VQQIFEDQARRTPEQVAVIFEHQQLTYGEVNGRANQVAHYLKGVGVGPETLVGVFVERSADMVVALLGILKAGASYVPLDPSFPQNRLAYMIEDSGMRVLLTHQQLEKNLPVRPAVVIRLDADWPEIAKQSDASAELPAGKPQDLAYVLYTSGSTGKPKAVEIQHSALVNFLLSMQCEPGFTAADTLLAVTTLSFDIAGLEIYLPLVSGGRVVIAASDDSRDPTRLMKQMSDSACTVMQATPATWRALLDAGWSGSGKLRVLCGGEAFPADLVGQLLPRCSELWNMYGPTETTIWSTIHRVTSTDGPVPIGRPIGNTKVLVLDGTLNLVPKGAVGELYIGGAGLARGYLGRPELTQAQFVQSPFEPGSRLYRTGDLARWLPDGTLECLGRVDDQVKIRGYRVELGEIESVILEQPGIRQAVVAARADSSGLKRMAAYIVPEDSANPAIESRLRDALKQKLPDYMIPSAFVVVAELPLTPNGKVDRKALPAPSYENAQAAHEFVGPRNETERALAAIWTEVLKVERIGINDDFFDLGGHSLLAIRALSRIRNVFEVDLSPRAFFSRSTIAGLAKALVEAQTANAGIARIEPRTENGPCPLSFAQERLWFLDQLAPGSPVYNIVDVIRFDGEVDAKAMKRALNELVRRHEALRTIFSNRDGQPMQIVLPSLEVVLPEIDLSSIPEQSREGEWIRVARDEGRKPFNLSRPSLFRGMLAHLTPQEHLLLLTVHHIIADEWSMEVLHKELRQLYEAFSLERPSPLPELPVQYADFAFWQREWLRGEPLQKQISYWKNELTGAPPVLQLPTDKPRPTVQSFRGATEFFQLPKELLESLKSIGRQEQATLFMTLLAGFLALLHRYTGQDDILVGTPISGRTRSETEGLIGLFLNTVVLRADFTGHMNFRSLLRQMRERALGAYGHQDLPLDQLVAELAPERTLGSTPLFQVMFVLYNAEGTSQASSVEGVRQLQTGTSKFDLTLSISETEDGLKGLIE
jgi:amino acid adenylation domain-containing protein